MNLKDDALAELEFSGNAIMGRILQLDEKTFNEKPSNDAWSAGQITEHLLKSAQKVMQVIGAEGIKADRNPDIHLPRLRQLMLDLSEKRKSAEDLLPADHENYNELSTAFDKAVNDLIEKGKSTDLSVVPDKVSFYSIGTLTKLEWLYFLSFHFKRHWYQMQKLHQML